MWLKFEKYITEYEEYICVLNCERDDYDYVTNYEPAFCEFDEKFIYFYLKSNNIYSYGIHNYPKMYFICG